MACNNPKFVGRNVVVEYVIGCGDQLPASSDWKRFGSMRAKEFNLGWDTTDATDADIIGYLRENLATFQTLEVSGDGILKVSGDGADNLKEIQLHVAKPNATSGQPVAWIRFTFPDLTFTAFMIITSFNRSAPYDEVATYSFEASATASDFGLIVEETPNPNAPTPTTVSAYPEAVTLAPGSSQRLAASVAPATASQNLVWSSSAPEVATVTQAGIVTAVADGTATITARSSVVSSVIDTVAVTVE